MVPVTATLTAAPAQHRQPSRKGKKAWRKNVDVSDVQDGLEEARDEVIKGGIISEKPSESLFAIDTTGSEAIKKTYKLHKPLKADEILAQRSAIESVATHKRPHGTTDGVIEPSNKKRKSNGVSHREYERLRQIAFGGSQVKDILKTDETPSHDPWAVDLTKDAVDPQFDYLEKEKPIVAPRTLNEAPISLVKSGKSIPAVTKPRAGTSYNPLFEDWSGLLKVEGEKAIIVERKRLAEARVESEKLERIKAAEDEQEWNEGWQTEEESAWEGFESDYEGEGLKKKKRPERKTPHERKKVERRKEKERLERIERKEKERARREKRIGEIKKEVDKEARQRSISKIEEVVDDSANEEIDGAQLRRRKLGKDALQEAPLELVLPDELQDSLRLLRPEGNLLKERFRSIMVRGKVEMRKPIQQAKKRKRKVTEKWTHKDFQIGVAGI